MTEGTDTRSHVVAAITEVAPELESADIAGDADLVDELELDSMDLLNVAVGVYQRTGVDIPERDFPALRTVDALVGYIGTANAQT